MKHLSAIAIPTGENKETGVLQAVWLPVGWFDDKATAQQAGEKIMAVCDADSYTTIPEKSEIAIICGFRDKLTARLNAPRSDNIAFIAIDEVTNYGDKVGMKYRANILPPNAPIKAILTRAPQWQAITDSDNPQQAIDEAMAHCKANQWQGRLCDFQALDGVRYD